MNLKWLFWTGLLALVLFFGVIYFGINNNWVGNSRPTVKSPSLNSNEQSQVVSSESSRLQNNVAQSTGNSTFSKGNGKSPELIDEEPIASSVESTLGSSELEIEEIVAQCQQLSESVGIPENKLEQAIIECVDRNSTHLTTENKELDERAIMVREQCNVAITQKELLSEEEIKMLVDECVASMSPE